MAHGARVEGVSMRRSAIYGALKVKASGEFLVAVCVTTSASAYRARDPLLPKSQTQETPSSLAGRRLRLPLGCSAAARPLVPTAPRGASRTPTACPPARDK